MGFTARTETLDVENLFVLGTYFWTTPHTNTMRSARRSGRRRASGGARSRKRRSPVRERSRRRSRSATRGGRRRFRGSRLTSFSLDKLAKAERQGTGERDRRTPHQKPPPIMAPPSASTTPMTTERVRQNSVHNITPLSQPIFESHSKHGYVWSRHAWNMVFVRITGLIKYRVNTFLNTVYREEVRGGEDMNDDQIIATAKQLLPTEAPPNPRVSVIQDERNYMQIRSDTTPQSIQDHINYNNNKLATVFVHNGEHPDKLRLLDSIIGATE